MDRYTNLDWASWALSTIGALNWGLRGMFQFDLVESLFGRMSGMTNVVYTLVGLSGIWSLVRFSQHTSMRAPTHRIEIAH
jgi:uncharacterized protein